MPIFFVDYDNRVTEFVKEYEEYIKYNVERRFHLKNQWEDMKQFITMEILRVYHKRNKYTDFDWVIRQVIRRKAIDFQNYFSMRNKNIIFENQCGEKDLETVNKIDKFNEERSSLESIKSIQKLDNKIDVINLLNNIKEKITNPNLFGSYFIDWDREYVEVCLELYELGCDVIKEEIMECMGYEESESSGFSARLLSFRKKLSKYLDLDVNFNM